MGLLLSSCSSIKYNYGLINNHLSIIKNAQPIDTILAEETTNSELKTKLRLVNKIKDFAYAELQFRETKSYSLIQIFCVMLLFGMLWRQKKIPLS